jgi:uncharacterized phage protein (TIGR01671 family)
MREIKFRAWDKKLNKYIDMFLGFVLNDGVLEYLEDVMNVEKQVIIEQYTGLKDKNGVEIYAGDIVKLYAEVYDTFGFEITKKETGKIVFNSGAFFISTDTENDPIYAYEDDFEVIGNIHENADLLEEL